MTIASPGGLDIGALQAFVAVAGERSFSRASERLHLTQPAVSKRVAALETALGRRLFDRMGREVALTEAGRAILPRARSILDDVREIRRLVDDLTGEVRGALSIASSHHIGLHHLPPILKRYAILYPDVELNLQFMASETACEQVSAGRLELALVTLPPDAEAALATTPLWDDPLDFVVAADHPLAREAEPTLADLGRTPAILPTGGTFTREIIARGFVDAGIDIRPGLETNYLETIKMMVTVGLGWGVLPRTMLGSELAVLPIAGSALTRQLGAVRHRGRSISNAGRAMLDLLTRADQEIS
jgi:DNA-binding transcriptional LysR family regulator